MIVDLHLKGGLVIIAGAGAEGMRKVDALLSQDCKIIVYSETGNARLEEYAESGKIIFKKTKLHDAEFLSGHTPYIVMAATDNRELNKSIAKKAKSMGCITYAADDPEFSDFAHPSVINIKDTIQIAVSTGGKSPVMARKIRQNIEDIIRDTITSEDILQTRLQNDIREQAKKTISSQKARKKYLYCVIKDEEIKQLIKDGKFKMARRRAMTLLEDWK